MSRLVVTAKATLNVYTSWERVEVNCSNALSFKSRTRTSQIRASKNSRHVVNVDNLKPKLFTSLPYQGNISLQLTTRGFIYLLQSHYVKKSCWFFFFLAGLGGTTRLIKRLPLQPTHFCVDAETHTGVHSG